MRHTPATPAARLVVPTETGQRLDDATIDKVVMLLLTVRSRGDVLRACTSSLRLAEPDAAAAMEEALRRISLAADVDYDFERGKSAERLDNLYQLAIQAQNPKTALDVLKERSKLLALYPCFGVGADPQAASSDDSAALDQLAAVRDQLAPLVPDASPDEPVDELARRVVALFTRGIVDTTWPPK